MNAEIQAAVVFAERLGVDVQSDFQRHHRHRKPPCRINDDDVKTTTSPDILTINVFAYICRDLINGRAFLTFISCVLRNYFAYFKNKLSYYSEFIVTPLLYIT